MKRKMEGKGALEGGTDISANLLNPWSIKVDHHSTSSTITQRSICQCSLSFIPSLWWTYIQYYLQDIFEGEERRVSVFP